MAKRASDTRPSETHRNKRETKRENHINLVKPWKLPESPPKNQHGPPMMHGGLPFIDDKIFMGEKFGVP